MVAPTDAPVLITGETGVGKELIASPIHASGPRRDHTMVRVDCTAVPHELFESEFFGHVRGAFSGASRDRLGRFQLADGGSLFLDEVGGLPLEMQPIAPLCGRRDVFASMQNAVPSGVHFETSRDFSAENS